MCDDWVTVLCGSKDDYKRQTTNYKHDALIIDLSFGFNLAFAYEWSLGLNSRAWLEICNPNALLFFEHGSRPCFHSGPLLISSPHIQPRFQ